MTDESIRIEAEKKYPYWHGDTDIHFGHNSMQAGKRIGYEEAKTEEREKVKELLDALAECDDYMDNKAEVDYEDGYKVNVEMKLLTTIRKAIANYNSH